MSLLLMLTYARVTPARRACLGRGRISSSPSLPSISVAVVIDRSRDHDPPRSVCCCVHREREKEERKTAASLVFPVRFEVGWAK